MVKNLKIEKFVEFKFAFEFTFKFIFEKMIYNETKFEN